MKLSQSKIVFILICLPWLLGGCAFGSCSRDEVFQAHEALLAQMEVIPDFTQSDQLDPMNLSGIESAVDNIWETPIPNCMEVAQFYAANAVFSAWKAVKAYQTEADSDDFQKNLETSQAYLDNYHQEMERIQGCLPFCGPTSIDE